MKILRTKNFTRRDHLSPSEWLINGTPENIELKVKVEESDKFKRQFKQQLPSNQEIINNFKSDIKNNFYYIDGPHGGDTHWLKDFSHKGKSHMMSKRINYHDRLNYRIYKPELDEYDEEGNLLPVQKIKIVLESCEGHGRNGAKNYSEIQGS